MMQESVELLFRIAQTAAARGQFEDLVTICDQIAANAPEHAPTQQRLAALYASSGFVTRARDCLEAANRARPGNLGILSALAGLARDMGDHAEVRRVYTSALDQFPDHPVIQRNELMGLEYDALASDSERLSAARKWGIWAVQRAGGSRPRPPQIPLNDGPLRVGYVSADFCQHTVGLFVKDVLHAHDPEHIQVFTYSAGHTTDWLTASVRAVSIFRNVGGLDDAALAAQIRADGIHVLVDLSGHTAGSRLTVFALRPAPVMVSWLGYFATTGLPYMDAVLLDEWHAPAGTTAQFVEPIICLSRGRFCYQPVPWAPKQVQPPAQLRNGYVTFGCFNNTAKLNDSVFDLWASVLQAVPQSCLILKWRTFNDDGYRQQVIHEFVSRGIESGRIELRGPSFHADVLKEYADIDIALDPFPFTGGLTSCEALWMGVPVITWPQSRVVSRQTHAILHQIGLPELSAQDANDYVRIAAELADDCERLIHYRTALRDRMRASILMDVQGFTRHLEHTLIDLYRRIEAE